MAHTTMWAKPGLDLPSRSRMVLGMLRKSHYQQQAHLPCYKTFGSFHMDKNSAGVLPRRILPLNCLGVALTQPVLTTPEIKSTVTVRLYSSKPTLDSIRHLLQGLSPKRAGRTRESTGNEESDCTRNGKNGKKNSIELDALLFLGVLGIALLASPLLLRYPLSETHNQKKDILVTLEEQLHNVLEATKDDFHIIPEYVSRTLDDVKGIDDSKMKMSSIIEFLRYPTKTNSGTELTKGVLLNGPPGTGKTLLAKAVAGEAKVPFFYLRGSELERSFPRLAVQRIRRVFEAAKANAPCVLFVDRIDLLGCNGGVPEEEISSSSNSIRKQLVAEIDGIDRDERVMLIASTTSSRRSYVDKDFLQRGRIDWEIKLFAPDVNGRKDIIQKSLLNVKLCFDVSIDEIAELTLGFTGAELKSMINQAAGRAVSEGADSVGKKHLDFGMQMAFEGFYKTGRLEILNKEMKSIAACHLAGRVLVGMYTEYARQIEWVTIVPRVGSEVGEIFYRTEGKAEGRTRAKLVASMDQILGGIAAREVLFDAEEAIVMIAGSNMEDAIRVAKSLVISPERLATGKVVILSDQEASEINFLLRESYNRAKQILIRHIRHHKALTEALVNHETLNAGQVKSILMQVNENASAVPSEEKRQS